MRLASWVISAFTLVAGPVAAADQKTAPPRARTVGTVYHTQPEQGRVLVMDHQERIYVLSTQAPGLRCRNRNIAPGHLRAGDKVWFSAVASR